MTNRFILRCHRYLISISHMRVIKENYLFQETDKENDITASEHFSVKLKNKKNKKTLYLEI